MPYADIGFGAKVRETLAEHWGLDAPESPGRLHGGEESAAFEVGTRVVRVGPRHRSASEIEWCHAIASRAAEHMPEAVAPCPTFDGATVAWADGRPVSVWPRFPGTWPTPEAPGMALRAAVLLARLHSVLADLRPPPRPVPSFLESGVDGNAFPDDPRLVDPHLDLWLSEFHRAGHARQPLHGDFYAGNTLAVDGVFTAVLDWDDVWIGPAAAEVASAAMEWTDEFGEDPEAMGAFADAYARAGGPAGRVDGETLAQFARHRLRREAAYFHMAQRRGTVHDGEDVAYYERRVEAFARLRPVTCAT